MARNEHEIQATAVKRLIRCRKTLRYFSGNGWTSDPNAAKSFAHVIDAARVCADKQLENVDLVLQLPEAKTELFSTPMR
jgi:hypothetical protein